MKVYEISNDNGVRVVNFATSKNLIVKSTMFPNRNFRKHTWTSPDWNTHNQTDPMDLHSLLRYSFTFSYVDEVHTSQ
jgi:hypothetical protein